jgi:GNAT superfamily N-acetyltransferase
MIEDRILGTGGSIVEQAQLDSGYHIAYVDNPEESAWGIIGRGVGAYNREQTGASQFERLCYVLRGPDDEIVGGVLGEAYYGWLFVDLLWVKEELRGRGHGHDLLTTVEEAARQRGAQQAYLDTFSFQAPEFYKQHGYEVFAELQDFPPGHQRYFMRKRL